MKWVTDNAEKSVRDIIRERLAHDPYSQDYVDSLVKKALEELNDISGVHQIVKT